MEDQLVTCCPTCACQCHQQGCGCNEADRPFVPNRPRVALLAGGEC